jgi:hypothetical protein
VRYQRATKGPLAAERELALHERRGFLWIRELADHLTLYEQQRQEYPTLADYFPAIIRFFNTVDIDDD